MYQRLILIGHLGNAPEMRYTKDGVPVASFSVATSRRWKDQSGQQQEKTIWFRVTAWKQTAEACNQYLQKGSLVMVDGELSEPKPYQRNDGTYAASLDVRAMMVKFLSSDKNIGIQTGVAASADTDIPF